jgi:hypothetical protein
MKPIQLLFLAASPVFATNALDRRITNLEQQMDEVRECTALGNAGAKTASATADIDCPVSFFSIEMLYWKPFIGGSDFAFTDDAFPVAIPYMGNLAEINSDWHFGFRAGLGYRFSNIDWVINAEYTRLKFASLEHTSANGGISASGLFLAGNETSAKAKWALSFNVLDVDLSRPYFLRPRFSLEPRIGLRSAWITQRDHAQYFNASNDQSRLLKYVNSASGIGIFGGTRMSWHWSRQWSLYGGASASLIYGKMNVAAKSMNFAVAPAIPLDVSADTYKVLPNMSIDTGLQWQMCWKAVCLSLAAGYDFQYWWRQNQRPHLDANTNYSWIRHAEDLGFQGFKLSAALDY